jgi:hypothetical protein
MFAMTIHFASFNFHSYENVVLSGRKKADEAGQNKFQ